MAEKLPKGFSRNDRGGLVAPEPGGYEREWAGLMGKGIYPWPLPPRHREPEDKPSPERAALELSGEGRLL